MITSSTVTSFGTNLFRPVDTKKLPPRIYSRKNKPCIDYSKERNFGLHNPSNGHITHIQGFLPGEILKKLTFDTSSLSNVSANTTVTFSVGIIDSDTKTYVPEVFLFSDLTVDELKDASLKEWHTFKKNCTLVVYNPTGGNLGGMMKLKYDYWGRNVKPADPFRGKKIGKRR